MIKIVYSLVIAVSVFFNSIAHSYAYTAWKSGIPIYALYAAGGNVQAAIFEMDLEDLVNVNIYEL